MFEEFIRALFLIFMAEMGDKTQILAIAFATKYEVKKVIAGIFIGSLLNHGLAVMLGAYLSTLIPIQTIQVVAGFSFIAFALWTLRVEGNSEEEKNKQSFGAVITVAIAFFIGELGDKTQLATIMLAADASFPFVVLLGTVSGMVITGGLGIIVGSKLGDQVPELAIKMVSAAIFMFFGTSKLYESLPAIYINPISISLFTLIIVISVIVLIQPVLRMRKQGKKSAFKQASKELYAFYQLMNKQMNHICLGENECGVCQKNNCIIGYTKALIEEGEKGKGVLPVNELISDQLTNFQKSFSKTYDRENIIKGLGITLKFIKYYRGASKELEAAHEIRKNLEMLLFEKSVEKVTNVEEYIKQVEEMDKLLAQQLNESILIS